MCYTPSLTLKSKILSSSLLLLHYFRNNGLFYWEQSYTLQISSCILFIPSSQNCDRLTRVAPLHSSEWSQKHTPAISTTLLDTKFTTSRHEIAFAVVTNPSGFHDSSTATHLLLEYHSGLLFIVVSNAKMPQAAAQNLTNISNCSISKTQSSKKHC